MIKINITITDTPLPDDRYYGRIEAFPDNVEPVSDHERMIRNLIMESIREIGNYLATNMQGVTGAFVAEVPVSQRKEKDEPPNRHTRRG